MMKILVCVCAEKIPDLFSWQIMRRFKAPVSHIYIRHEDMILEASDGGVKLKKCPPTFAIEHYEFACKEVILSCTLLEFEHWVSKNLGKPYGTSQIPGYFVPKFLRFLFKNGRKKGICCELVHWLMKDLSDHPNFRDDSESDFCKPWETFNLI